MLLEGYQGIEGTPPRWRTISLALRLLSRLAGATVVQPSALYPRVLRRRWTEVHPDVRAVHLDELASVLQATGSFVVCHGGGRLVRLVVRLLRMPAEGEDVETRLSVFRNGSGERWCRTFAGRRLATVQYQTRSGLLAERFGLLEFRFRLSVEGGALLYQQAGASVGLGLLMLPLPQRISPQVTAREESIAGSHRVRTMVRVALPLLGPLITYSGDIEPEGVA